MINIGLSVIEALILLSISLTAALFIAGIGTLVRFTTRPPGSKVSVFWIGRLGIFAGAPFSIIGMTSGYLTGLSRVSAVSALVPAGLTLIGGIGIYLFGKGGKPALLAMFAVVNFSVMIMIGALIGGRERVQIERAERSVEYQEQEIEKDFLLNEYRRGLGLPPVERKQAPASGTSD